MEDIEFEIHVIINERYAGKYKINVECFNKLQEIFKEKGDLKPIYQETYSFTPYDPDFDYEKDIQC